MSTRSGTRRTLRQMSELPLVRGQLFSLCSQCCLYSRLFGVPVNCFFDQLMNNDASRGLVMHECRGTKDCLAVGCQSNINLRVFATHMWVRPCYTVRCSTPRAYLD
jgi:hypothetical protein